MVAPIPGFRRTYKSFKIALPACLMKGKLRDTGNDELQTEERTEPLSVNTGIIQISVYRNEIFNGLL